MRASAPSPSSAVNTWVSRDGAARAATLEKKPLPCASMPSRLGSCLLAMTSATPALKPMRIGSEMKLTSWFSRRTQAARLMAATISAVAAASWP